MIDSNLIMTNKYATVTFKSQNLLEYEDDTKNLGSKNSLSLEND